MNVAFRVDASSLIGTGHLMRCLTLADALKSRGTVTRFLSRQMPDHFRDLISKKGHEFSSLNSRSEVIVSKDIAHAAWLGTTQEADARDVLRSLSDQSWDWLVVDHYAIDERWEVELRPLVGSILVIDDLADRHHHCDVLLDQNFYLDMYERYVGKVPSTCQLLLGPQYALLRDEFRVLHERARIRTGPVHRILVFFGGMDADNYTSVAIEALSKIGLPGLEIDVVMGSKHPFLDEIKARCFHYGFTCHVQTERMAELMAKADLSIGAGGTAIWERCCLGLPSITVSTANNQDKQILDAALVGLLYVAGKKEKFNAVIERHINAIIENSCLRQFISTNSIRLVDAAGASRVAAKMISCNIEVRAVRQSDSENLFNWRNHPIIRAVSRNSDPVSWEGHQSWFKSLLSDPHRFLVIGEINAKPVGVARFDNVNSRAEVSIYLVPDISNSGLGSELLHSAECWLLCNHPEIKQLTANVLANNERSKRLFLGAGYQLEATSYTKRLN